MPNSYKIHLAEKRKKIASFCVYLMVIFSWRKTVIIAVFT